MFQIILMTAGLLTAIPSAGANFTDSLRCDNGLVSVGDHRDDVQAACGAPAFVDASEVEKIIRTYQKIHGRPSVKKDVQHQPVHETPDSGRGSSRNIDRDYRLVSERSVIIVREEWTYNFGSSRFIQTLFFEGSRLVSISTGSYGFNKIPNEGSIVSKGDSKALVFMKYGPPDRKETIRGTEGMVNYHEDGRYLYAEEIRKIADEVAWVYDFGPDRFLQRLIFKDNRLIDIRSLQKRGRRT